MTLSIVDLGQGLQRIVECDDTERALVGPGQALDHRYSEAEADADHVVAGALSAAVEHERVIELLRQVATHA